MPKFSIIVPIYNKEKYIERCIKSILNQTMQDFEIIILNDGSTDKSEEVLLKYINKNKEKIIYFKQDNHGIAQTRNNAIEKVTGEYFLFIDADDYIENNLLEKLNYITIEEKIDIVKYKMNVIDAENVKKIEGPTFNVKTGEDAFNELCFKESFCFGRDDRYTMFILI